MGQIDRVSAHVCVRRMYKRITVAADGGKKRGEKKERIVVLTAAV